MGKLYGENNMIPASKVLLFFETCFFCAPSSTESSGEIRTSCYCLCLFLCCSSAAALQATFVQL